MSLGGKPMESLGIMDVAKGVNLLENGFYRDLLYFDGSLEGQKIRVLFDGGSMGDFVAVDFVKKHRMKTHPVVNQVLSFANGEQAPCNKEVRSVKIQVGNYVDQVRLKVAPLPHHDVILGKPWLERYNPDIDWVKNEITLTTKEKTVPSLI
jgi:hypothetical protein